MRRPLLTLTVLCLLAVAGCTTGGDAAAPSSGRSGSTVRSSSTTAVAPSSPSSPRSSASGTRTSSSPAPSSSRPSATVPAGTTIALNPGHNGGNGNAPDVINRDVPSGFGQYRACDTTGTETDAGYSEHAFNWDVTLRLRRVLQAHGVKVVLTRLSDTGIGPCIDTRADIANAPGIAAAVSIHADGAPASGHGFHICEDSRQPAGAATAAASHALTVAVHDALVRGSGFTTSTYLGQNGYFPRDDLAGLNLATVPATFAELGNMRNAGDAAIQTSAAGRQRIANALATGILAWLAAR